MILLAFLLQMTSLEKRDPRPTAPTAAWLVGIWLHSADRDDLERVACNSGTAFAYRPDGTTQFFEGAGQWRLNGDKLVVVTTEIGEAFAEPELVAEIGKPQLGKLIRLGPHEGVLILPDGTRDRMLRCRPDDIQ
jgi:hypothetical protein